MNIYDRMPTEAKNILILQPAGVRGRVLDRIEELEQMWHDEGANFDPIQWELILNSLTVVLVSLFTQLRDEKNLIDMMLGST